MKMNPIKPIIKVETNEELDTEEEESNTDEQESTISIKEEDEYSTFSDISKQDSEFDINVHETQDEQNTQTPETLHYNTTMHNKDDLIYDEYDKSEDENKTVIETYEDFGEKIHSCNLEFQSDLKAKCLVTTHLWLTAVQASIHLPYCYQRNQL